jgi:hypothetical protein
MDDFYGPIDFSGFVGCPHYESSDVFENTPDYGDHDDANTHIRAFTKCIDEWYDPPIYEDVLMKLFAVTLDAEKPLIGFIIRLMGDSRPYRACCMPFWKGLGMIGVKFTMNWLMILWKHGRGKIF